MSIHCCDKKALGRSFRTWRGVVNAIDRSVTANEAHRPNKSASSPWLAQLRQGLSVILYHRLLDRADDLVLGLRVPIQNFHDVGHQLVYVDLCHVERFAPWWPHVAGHPTQHQEHPVQCVGNFQHQLARTCVAPVGVDRWFR